MRSSTSYTTGRTVPYPALRLSSFEICTENLWRIACTQVRAYICREDKPVFFHKISEPSDQDIAELLESIIEAVELCLSKCGLLDEKQNSEISEDMQSVEAASRASVTQRIAFGERCGLR